MTEKPTASWKHLAESWKHLAESQHKTIERRTSERNAARSEAKRLREALAPLRGHPTKRVPDWADQIIRTALADSASGDSHD
jgi:hypothetical protein